MTASVITSTFTRKSRKTRSNNSPRLRNFTAVCYDFDGESFDFSVEAYNEFDANDKAAELAAEYGYEVNYICLYPY